MLVHQRVCYEFVWCTKLQKALDRQSLDQKIEEMLEDKFYIMLYQSILFYISLYYSISFYIFYYSFL